MTETDIQKGAGHKKNMSVWLGFISQKI